jgi:AcrR family transcriptional regulator
MPKQVDHEARREAIIQATEQVIAERGLAGLSFREIGKRLGGSSTLVTHYYNTQSELFEDLAVRSVRAWRADLKAIERRYPDRISRLHALLFEWLLPIQGDDLDKERARINLVAAGNLGAETQPLLDAWEAGMQGLLHELLRGLVPDDEVDLIADLLRSASNGIALSAVEHPEYWTAERQTQVFRKLVGSLGILEDSGGSTFLVASP